MWSHYDAASKPLTSWDAQTLNPLVCGVYFHSDLWKKDRTKSGKNAIIKKKNR